MLNLVISAAEANREFSRMLREVRDGRSVTITAHGKPLARLVPCAGDEAARDEAWAELLQHLRVQPAVAAGPWTRAELYEDAPLPPEA